MRISRVFTDQPLAPDTEFQLGAGASGHLIRALRLAPGAVITVFNGTGGEYSATIVSADKRQVTVLTQAFHPDDRESPLELHLGIAISRGERMDWVMQKATELGVQAIHPLSSERTEVKLKGERRDKKIQHWQQIAISACEQCGRNRIPQITPLQPLDAWLPEVNCERKFVLHHRSDQPLEAATAPASAALLIGPEGGLSAEEIDLASAQGFEPLRLGPRVLRTETAPLAAIALLQYHWGDF